MPITACKGTVDILPAETPRWRYVEEIAHRVAQLFGFKEIRTPAFEVTELFTESIGEDSDVVEKELYTFRDKSGRSLTLRPELTTPTVRAWLEHNLSSQNQVKTYYLGEIWRYERPQAGRLREAHQFGVEAIGSASPAVDAELVDMAMTFLKQIGLKELRLEVNSIGCKKCRPVYQGVLKDFFMGKDDVLCQDCERRKEKNPLRVLDCRKEACLAVTNTAPTVFQSLCPDCKQHFFLFKEHLTHMGYSVFGNPRVVHGLNYYSRTVFQIHSIQLGPHNAICAGGRFDDLIGQLGSSGAPAMGFAIGLERTLMAMEKESVAIPDEPRVDAFFVGTGEEAERIMSRVMHSLRARGWRVDRDYLSRGVKNQLKASEKLNPAYTVMVGEEDTRVTQVQVTDNARGTQESVNVNRLMDALEFRFRREQRDRSRGPVRDRDRDVAVDEVPEGRGRGRGRGRDRDRDRGRLPEAERAPRQRGEEQPRGPRQQEGEEGSRFAEWAATYAEAARSSVPRPVRRVPLSESAFDGEVGEAGERWATAQAGLQAPSSAPSGPWPAAPLTLSTPLPPPRERELATYSPTPAGQSWLEPEAAVAVVEAETAAVSVEAWDDEGEAAEPPRLTAETVDEAYFFAPDAGFDQPAMLRDDDGDDDENGDGDDDEGGEDNGGELTAAGGVNGESEAEKRRRGGRRGGRRHGRRKAKSKS